MDRFITLIWNEADQDQATAALDVENRLREDTPGWACAFEEKGIRIFHSGGRGKRASVYLLHDGAGAIVGTLFRRGTENNAGDHVAVDVRETNLIVNSEGRHLVAHYWGRYVAFFNDSACGARFVLRDPAAAIPCYMRRYRGVAMFFSHIEDLCLLGCFRFSVNWRYVAAHLFYDCPRTRETGLEGVTEILPGESIRIDGDVETRAFLWHPADFCRDDVIEDSVEAARSLRQTTRACVEAWASSYDSIVHELSGGLDSAIVLGCLSRATVHPDLVCLNVFTDRAEGDERAFARVAAAAAGVPLVEREIRSSQTTLKRLLDIPKLARPHISAIGLVLDEAYVDLARTRDARAFFSGQGGDHLFHQRKTSLVAADYVHRHGFDWRLLSLLMDTARATQQSFWRVGAAAVGHGKLSRPTARHTDLERENSFLNPDIVQTLQDGDFLHPWFAACRDLPPAKLLHIADLVNLQGYYFSFGRAACADLVHPLFSQPIVELSLRIPTYVLTGGGRDRALARRAFADIVPKVILDRETKGEITGFYNALLSRDLGFVRELLLEGILADRKLLDRDRLARQLTEDRIVRGDRIVDILICLGVEAWVRAWADAGMKA